MEPRPQAGLCVPCSGVSVVSDWAPDEEDNGGLRLCYSDTHTHTRAVGDTTAFRHLPARFAGPVSPLPLGRPLCSEREWGAGEGGALNEAGAALALGERSFRAWREECFRGMCGGV